MNAVNQKQDRVLRSPTESSIHSQGKRQNHKYKWPKETSMKGAVRSKSLACLLTRESIYVYKNMEIFWNKCKIILIRRCSSVGERRKPKSQRVPYHSSGQRAENHLIPGKGCDQPALESGCPGQMLVHFATRKLHFRKTEISPDIY